MTVKLHEKISPLVIWIPMAIVSFEFLFSPWRDDGWKSGLAASAAIAWIVTVAYRRFSRSEIDLRRDFSEQKAAPKRLTEAPKEQRTTREEEEVTTLHEKTRFVMFTRGDKKLLARAANVFSISSTVDGGSTVRFTDGGYFECDQSIEELQEALRDEND